MAALALESLAKLQIRPSMRTASALIAAAFPITPPAAAGPSADLDRGPQAAVVPSDLVKLAEHASYCCEGCPVAFYPATERLRTVRRSLGFKSLLRAIAVSGSLLGPQSGSLSGPQNCGSGPVDVGAFDMPPHGQEPLAAQAGPAAEVVRSSSAARHLLSLLLDQLGDKMRPWFRSSLSPGGDSGRLIGLGLAASTLARIILRRRPKPTDALAPLPDPILEAATASILARVRPLVACAATHVSTMSLTVSTHIQPTWGVPLK